ncbi:MULTISPECIES: glycerophosphodiester phosphodiesterase family protein [unclassified Spirosoma]|uniref:glycerophosphodiester phosphodiesterase family protein n=1 Tax=unclassified Spirosoma TaxID=2621999 RepID=UPI00095B96B4|nr:MULTISPECIES: glycerophosphodiester phosphodiesterase family protein [unclassified Spirosoma]MBN8826480.1 glycerophosphodiester phosphodiesterase family protein [Spirosoma sp.]OJW76428.1 MAG: glycerophosphodiester phosphodiesterase [Spirosoma sp. 48-14]
MQSKHFFLAGLAFCITACAPKATTNLSKSGAEDFFQYKPNRAPLISVHRGGGDLKGYPENCIESFAYVAQQIGSPAHPAIIECDIDLTKDSVMVMMHDATLDRTTTGTGKLIDKTYAELAQYRLEDNMGTVTPYKIPTLEQVLRWGKNKVRFTLDVKRNVSFAKVVDMIHKTGASDYACVITYNAQDAAKLHQLDPNLMLSVTIRNQAEYDRLREVGVPDNRMVAFVGVKEPDAELYSFLHQKGIATILGTLGNLDKQAAAKGDQVYKTFVQHGADIMSTDRPLEMARVLYTASK